jgi:hypothetical protein
VTCAWSSPEAFSAKSAWSRLSQAKFENLMNRIDNRFDVIVKHLVQEIKF